MIQVHHVSCALYLFFKNHFTIFFLFSFLNCENMITHLQETWKYKTRSYIAIIFK